MKSLIAVALSLAALAPLAHAEEHVGYDAERGDPARWYEPVATPRQRYANAMQEARNALAEALKECRAYKEGRKACEAEAREQNRRDKEQARRYLDTRTPAG